RHAGRLGLLDRLAEGLELTGVAEDVEGRVGPPQLLAVQLPGEDGVRHRGPERGAVGPVAHDDQSEIPVRPGAVGQGPETLDVLLRGESPDEPDHRPALRRPPAVQAHTATGRGDALLVHAPATQGTSSARGTAPPAAPRTNGESRCTTSGENSRRALYTLGLGAPTGNDEISGTCTEVTRWTGYPRWCSRARPRSPSDSSGAPSSGVTARTSGWARAAAAAPCHRPPFPDGATTRQSCPCRRAYSRIRRTELVTPLTFGRKDSVTMARRTNSLCAPGNTRR